MDEPEQAVPAEQQPPEPVELSFGDIVQVPLNNYVLGDPDVVVGLSEHELFLANIVTDEQGEQRLGLAFGTHYGPIQKTGRFGDTEEVIASYTDAMSKSRIKIPEDVLRETIEEMRKAAQKGPIMYTPPPPRDPSFWANIHAT